jgi:hypothetical protein
MKDIDPYSPPPGFPGSKARVLWYAARADLRLPLFDETDTTAQVDPIDPAAVCHTCGAPLSAGRRKHCSERCARRANALSQRRWRLGQQSVGYVAGIGLVD